MDFDRLTFYINFARILVRRDRLTYQLLKGTQSVASFSHVSDRIKALKEADAKAADQIVAAIEAHEKRRPEVVKATAEWLAAQKAELDLLDAGLNQLANSVGMEQDQNPIQAEGGVVGEPPPKS